MGAFGLGFRDYGLGIRFLGLGSGYWVLGFWDQALGLMGFWLKERIVSIAASALFISVFAFYHRCKPPTLKPNPPGESYVGSGQHTLRSIA